MAHAICLQPWINLGGNGQTIVQANDGWLDLAGYKAAAAYVEVADVPSQAVVTTIQLRTAPLMDQSMMGDATALAAAYSFSTTPSLGVQPIKVLRWRDTTLARYLHWTVIFGAAATQISFRIWLSLNAAGW